MKKLVLILILISGVSCTSSPKKTTEKEANDYGQEEIVVDLPTVKDTEERSPFFNTQKHIVGERNGLNYEIYYGTGGRYILLVKPVSSNVVVDFTKSEVSLVVGAGGDKPEVLVMSSDGNGIFQGVGDTRKGPTNFTLNFYIPASRYMSSIKEEISFSFNISKEL